MEDLQRVLIDLFAFRSADKPVVANICKRASRSVPMFSGDKLLGGHRRHHAGEPTL